MFTRAILALMCLLLLTGCNFNRIDGNKSAWIYYGEYDIKETIENDIEPAVVE